MGREDLSKLLSASADVSGSAVKGNLGMLSSPLPELGAVTVMRDTMDEVLGSSTLVRDALESLGFAPEGSLGPGERARFFAAYWNSLTGGAWSVPGHELDATFMMHVRAMITRVVRCAVTSGRLDASAAARGLGDLTEKLNPDNANLLMFSAHSLRKRLTGDMESRPAWGATGLPFPAFADALEALVQLADGHGSRAPGSLLLWRLYLLVRATEGFPAGAPHAAAGDSGFGCLSHGLSTKLATEDDIANLTVTRPLLCSEERYCIDVGPQQPEDAGEPRAVDMPLPPTAVLRAWAEVHQSSLALITGRQVRIAGDVDEFGATAVADEDDDIEAGVMKRLVRPEAVVSAATGAGPAWIDLRWSAHYTRPVSQIAAFGRDTGIVRRAWWSPGPCRVLDLRVDEEDAVKLPSLYKAAADLLANFSTSQLERATSLRTEQHILGGVLVAATLDSAAVMLQRARAWLSAHGGACAPRTSPRAAVAKGFFGGESTPVLAHDSSSSTESAALEAAGFEPSAAWSRAMMLPAMSSAPRAGVRGGHVQPRALTWFQRFEARMALDPTGDAAVARWLFTVLADPRPAARFSESAAIQAEAATQGAVVLAEAVSSTSRGGGGGGGGGAAPWSGSSSSKRAGVDSMRQARAVIEAGGPALLSQLMGLWYRTNLEIAAAASAVQAMRARSLGAGGSGLSNDRRAEHDSRVVSTVADAFQVPAVEDLDAMRAAQSSGGRGGAASAAGEGGGGVAGVPPSAPPTASRRIRALGSAASKGETAMRGKWDGSPLLERLRVVLEGFPSDPDGSESGIADALPLTWARAMEVGWPVMRDDALYAAYSLCFPAQQSWRLGFAPHHDELLAGQVDSDLFASLAAAATVPVWDGSGIPMGSPALRFADTPRSVKADFRGGSGEAAAAAAGPGAEFRAVTEQEPAVWDGVDPFQVEARWQAFRPRPEGCRPPNNGESMGKVLELLSRRSPGRVSVMRWLLEASDEATSARRCGVVVRDDGILSAYDSRSDAVDNWTVSVAVAVWAQVHKAAAVRARTSPFGSHLGVIKWGTDVATAHEHAGGEGLASTAGFEADVVAAATGLPKINAWSAQLAKGGQVGKEATSVRKWAREIMGVREDGSADPGFRVGWDTVVALMVWAHVERTLPTNAGAYVDMEPSERILHSSEQERAKELLAVPEELDWTTPARCMALLVGLSQARSTAVRCWAREAKALLAVMATTPNEGRISAAVTKKLPMSGLMSQTADWQSRTWRELYLRRAELQPKRLSVADWVQTITAGVDTVAHEPAADGMLCMMARLLRLVGSDSDELLMQLRAARK